VRIRYDTGADITQQYEQKPREQWILLDQSHLRPQPAAALTSYRRANPDLGPSYTDIPPYQNVDQTPLGAEITSSAGRLLSSASEEVSSAPF
jgi:hypothetical protein